MRHRSHGIYEFRTPPGSFGRMSATYRTLMERGDTETIGRMTHPEYTMVGYPYYPELEEDQSQGDAWVGEIQSTYHSEHWLSEIFYFFNCRILRSAKHVSEHFGMEYIKEHFCPVCWGRPHSISEKELYIKIGAIAADATVASKPSITLYNIAVTDESYRKYGISMPVVWMRYSFLKTFRTGRDLINVYRMMRGSEKVYDIPVFPYQGVPDFLL